MRQAYRWKPTKFIKFRGRLRGSRDTTQLGVGSRLFADRIAKFYDRYVKDNCRGDLIDLGCGRVPLYEIYRELVTSVTCVDWPDSHHGNVHVDVICDISKPLPFSDNSFDTVILSDVLEHIPTPEGLWAEMRRITRSGGKLLMSVPFFYWLHETPHDYYRYTEWALRRFAFNFGFDIQVLDAVGGSPEIVADILAKHIQHVPLMGHLLASALQSLTNSMTAIPFGRKMSYSTSRAFPYGYFLLASRQ